MAVASPERAGDVPTDLRAAEPLWRLRGRRAVVVVCRDAPEPFEAIREHLGRLGAELVVERRPGPLSRRVGRPAVVVCDRYLDVVAAGEDLTPEQVRETLEWSGARCEECPQSAEELPGLAAAWRSA
jgi:hypothetical protein